MKRPTTPEQIFGQEKYEQGYARGYASALWDYRKTKICKERNAFYRFGQFWDYLSDICEANRKR